jgi:hypothetical protein
VIFHHAPPLQQGDHWQPHGRVRDSLAAEHSGISFRQMARDRIRRREFIAALGGAALWPLTVRAEPSPPPLRPPPPVEGDPPPGAVLVPAGDTVHSGPSVDLAHGHLVVAPDNHHLMHADGTPFVYLADTAWCATRVNREGIDFYLEDRRAKGFTVIQMISFSFAMNGLVPPNFYGDEFFMGGHPSNGEPWDWCRLVDWAGKRVKRFLGCQTRPGRWQSGPAQLNPAYFVHIDYIIDKAAEKGIYVALLPWWTNYDTNETIFDTTAAFNYGNFLGSRYVNRANLIWVMGGDGPVELHGAGHIWQAMADGIRAGDGGKFLMTWHPTIEGGGGPQTPPYINFLMVQTGHYVFDNPLSYQWITQYYPVMPVLDGESRYEDDKTGFSAEGPPHDAYSTRQAAYWSILAGACGHTFGNLCVVFFSDDAWNASGFWQTSKYQGYTPATSGTRWTLALNTEGQRSMAHLRKLLDSRPFVELVPDQGLVTDELSGEAHIQAARGQSYAYVYNATGQPFTVNMGRISGSQVKAYWFDPETGEVIFIGRFDNTGQQIFAPRGNPGRRNDRVLILDDAGKNHSFPGQHNGER